MLPSELTAQSFAHYPPLARALALENLELLRQLPVDFAALLLREVSGYDWRFPAERRTLDHQFTFLRRLSAEQREKALSGFSAVNLTPQIEQIDWVASPQKFLDALTAHLWATHQIGMFRDAASNYFEAWRKAIPEAPPASPRICIVVLDESLSNPGTELFRKLRQYGVYFRTVDSTDAWPTALAFANSRAVSHPLEYGHWYIDGGSPDSNSDHRLTRISWTELESVRAKVLARIRKIVESGHGGPEQVQTLMGETTPKDAGFASTQKNEILTRFQVSVLTEGSGTQVFSTTFVQWTAREALRRAQPSTLLMRYRPRQRQRPMNDLVSGSGNAIELDPGGSLIDADMGAFYTWINVRRLAGAEQSAFVVWSLADNRAVAIGPGMPAATNSANAPTMKQVLGYFA